MLQFDDFKAQFNSIVQERALTWEVVGFYDKRKLIYPFGTDTKVISTVFESIASPIIHEIEGLNPGRGNTKNIGSFSSTIQGFRDGIGPFSRYGVRGKLYCDEYWKYYPQFRNLEDLESFLKEQYPDFNIS